MQVRVRAYDSLSGWVCFKVSYTAAELRVHVAVLGQYSDIHVRGICGPECLSAHRFHGFMSSLVDYATTHRHMYAELACCFISTCGMLDERRCSYLKAPISL